MPVFLDLNDNCVTLNDLYDSVSESYVNNATVTATITSATGTVLVNNAPMAYVAASNGQYRAIIPSSTSLGGAGSVVTVEIDAVGADSSVYQAAGLVAVKSRKLAG